MRHRRVRIFAVRAVAVCRSGASMRALGSGLHRVVRNGSLCVGHGVHAEEVRRGHDQGGGTGAGSSGSYALSALSQELARVRASSLESLAHGQF